MNLMTSIATTAWVAGFKAVSCRCEYCHRSMALRTISAHKAGIRMRDRWYCSSSCFTSAVEQELSELLTLGQDQGSPVSHKPLGMRLVDRGLLTVDQFKEVIGKQKQDGGEIGELLVRDGSVSEKQITAFRAMEWGCPVFSVPKHVVRTGIHIPRTLIQLYSAIPLHYVNATKVLLVGFVHRVEYGLLYAIEQVTGCKTQPCFVTPSDFQMQMQQLELAKEQCTEAAPAEVKFEDVQTTAEIARILCSTGVELEAEEALIGKCKGYIWARLKSSSKEFDLLFKAG